METTTTLRHFAPSHTDKKTRGVRGKEGEKRKRRGGSGEKAKKIRRTTATRTEPNAEMNVPGEKLPQQSLWRE